MTDISIKVYRDIVGHKCIYTYAYTVTHIHSTRASVAGLYIQFL